MNIYTIGHSVHSQEAFIHMLQTENIQVLVDVRAFPASRKFPHFSKERMQKWLPQAGIEYVHLLSLAGRRNKSQLIQSNINGGWRNQPFHNYADYTLTNEFQNGIKELKGLATEKRVVYCCAERHPSRCHRLLVSNWFCANGWDVKHIINESYEQTIILPHTLGQWGAMPIIESDGTVVYPI
ncbi:MAG TPA: DUF488 domain-containing protein [Virgibacillus sp.]|nr:DUF488 domain-containing protein [Virgibacillus sp.]